MLSAATLPKPPSSLTPAAQEHVASTPMNRWVVGITPKGAACNAACSVAAQLLPCAAAVWAQVDPKFPKGGGPSTSTKDAREGCSERESTRGSLPLAALSISCPSRCFVAWLLDQLCKPLLHLPWCVQSHHLSTAPPAAWLAGSGASLKLPLSRSLSPARASLCPILPPRCQMLT